MWTNVSLWQVDILDYDETAYVNFEAGAYIRPLFGST